MKRYLALAALLGAFSGSAVFGFAPLCATVRVSSGSLYDYVVLGEHPKATEGFDNAYDTISPGNLNAAMGEPFISVVVAHPDWKPAMRELRGDVRLPGKREQWRVAVTSSLPKGTPLKVALAGEESTLPGGARLLLSRDRKETELSGKGAYTLPAPGPGTTTTIFITLEQP
ncbi:MAG TPA: hypothetical protein DCZ75_15520 [Geobacter sp.]|nr:hypothetical protein [Geobacter sp.]